MNTMLLGQDKLDELFETDDDEWTEWEVKFIRDIENKGKQYKELSAMQQDKVDELFDKLKERSSR